MILDRIPTGPRLRAAAALLACSACSGLGFGPAPVALRLQLPPDAAPTIDQIRGQGPATLQTAAGHAVYAAEISARRGAAPHARLRLMDDDGNTVLDLVARPEGITGFDRSRGVGVQADLAADVSHTLDPLFLLGLTLLEVHVPVTADRILGSREMEGGGYQLLLRPVAVPGVEVIADVDVRGTVLGRQQTYRGVRWTDRKLGSATHRRVEIPGFQIEMKLESRETSAGLPAETFALTLPDGLEVLR